jgi:hypothetical protein
VVVVQQPAMTVHRVGIRKVKLCYLIKANRYIKYPFGSSPIVYMGTTRRGINRLANSAAYWAPEILGTHGITAFEVHVVNFTPRQHVQMWRKLERALLLTFRDLYGAVPLCNTQGVRMKERDEFRYFSRRRIEHILRHLP